MAYVRDPAFAGRLMAGRIAELWTIRDDLAVLLQLGAIRPPDAGRPFAGQAAQLARTGGGGRVAPRDDLRLHRRGLTTSQPPRSTAFTAIRLENGAWFRQ